MQKLCYLAVVGFVGCVGVGDTLAQGLHAENIDPAAFISVATAMPTVTTGRDLAAAQFPALPSGSTGIVDFAARAATYSDDRMAAQRWSGDSIESAAPLPSQASLGVGTMPAPPPMASMALAPEAPLQIAGTAAQTAADSGIMATKNPDGWAVAQGGPGSSTSSAAPMAAQSGLGAGTMPAPPPTASMALVLEAPSQIVGDRAQTAVASGIMAAAIPDGRTGAQGASGSSIASPSPMAFEDRLGVGTLPARSLTLSMALAPQAPSRISGDSVQIAPATAAPEGPGGVRSAALHASTVALNGPPRAAKLKIERGRPALLERHQMLPK